MEFVTRTATHPNPRISKDDAEKALLEHPALKPGSIIAGIERVNNHWVAKIKEPVNEKTAAPPAFLDDGEDKPPTEPSESKPETDTPSSDDDGPEDSEDKSDDGDDKDDGDGDKEPSISDVLDLVKQIAEKVGVPAEGPGDEHPAGPEDLLEGPPLDGPPSEPALPKGPAAGPAAAKPKRPVKPGEQLPGSGVTPVGAPSFSNVQNPFPQFIGKVATFDVHDDTDKPLKEAVAELNELVAPHDYAVTQVREGKSEEGNRRVFAQISRRKRK
jgi:hypothetical protein